MRQGLRFVGWCIYGVEIMFWVMSQTPDVWCSYRTFPQTTYIVGLYIGHRLLSFWV